SHSTIKHSSIKKIIPVPNSTPLITTKFLNQPAPLQLLLVQYNSNSRNNKSTPIPQRTNHNPWSCCSCLYSTTP
ncbi:hypothetical protein Leryth_006230, partial [Lithospermum erythrorhizon]